MTFYQKEYGELLALTKLALLRNFSLDDILLVDASTYALFADDHKEVIKRPSPSSASKEKRSLLSQPASLRKEKPLDSAAPPSACESGLSSPLSLSNSKPPVPVPSSFFDLQPLTLSSIDSQGILKNIGKEWFPDFPFCDQIPSDRLAHEVKQSWKKSLLSIIILSFDEGDKERAFLGHLAAAITRHLSSARVLSAYQIEKEKKWDILFNSSSLRFIIAGEYGLSSLPQLYHYYHSTSESSKHFLSHVPLLLLSPATAYFKDPKLKPCLWQAICQQFHSSLV